MLTNQLLVCVPARPALKSAPAWLWMLACCQAFAVPAFGQPAGGAPQTAASTQDDRALFPRNWARGYTDFEVAPPTNEPDLGRCLPSTGQFGGAAARCAGFARYMLSGYFELHPIGRTPLRRVFLFASPRLSLGDNVPQVSYTAALTPIALESLMGAGIELSKSFEIRVVRHSVTWLGRYRGYLGPAELGTTGPYGVYATVGVRWKFGGWGRE